MLSLLSLYYVAAFNGFIALDLPVFGSHFRHCYAKVDQQEFETGCAQKQLGGSNQQGCLAAAGYAWCPSLDKCARPFETHTLFDQNADGKVRLKHSYSLLLLSLLSLRSLHSLLSLLSLYTVAAFITLIALTIGCYCTQFAYCSLSLLLSFSPMFVLTSVTAIQRSTSRNLKSAAQSLQPRALGRRANWPMTTVV
jgi:hypothetical protein